MYQYCFHIFRVQGCVLEFHKYEENGCRVQVYIVEFHQELENEDQWDHPLTYK